MCSDKAVSWVYEVLELTNVRAVDVTKQGEQGQKRNEPHVDLYKVRNQSTCYKSAIGM